METRRFSLIDLGLGEIDKAIKVLGAPAHSSRNLPAAPEGTALPAAQRCVIFPAAGGHNLFASGRRIAADVVVIDVAGGRGEYQRERVRLLQNL